MNGFSDLKMFYVLEHRRAETSEPAQQKHVTQRMTIKMYEKTILPIYQKANIKLLSKTRVLALIIGLHKEYQ